MREVSANLDARETETVHDPAYCYVVTVGATKFHLTNHDLDLTFNNVPAAIGSDPQTFTAFQCGHTRPKQTTEMSSDRGLSFQFGLGQPPLSDQLRSLIVTSSKEVVTVHIIRAQVAGDPTALDFAQDAQLEFLRSVTAYGFPEEHVVSLGLAATRDTTSGQLFTYRYVPLCQVPLYGTRCGIDRDEQVAGDFLFRIDTTLTAVSRPGRFVDVADLVLETGTAITETMFDGGILVDSNGLETGILGSNLLPSSEGLRCSLIDFPDTLTVSAAVTLYRGCDKTRGVCLDEFDNLDNHRGMPFIPAINPVIHGVPE